LLEKLRQLLQTPQVLGTHKRSFVGLFFVDFLNIVMKPTTLNTAAPVAVSASGIVRDDTVTRVGHAHRTMNEQFYSASFWEERYLFRKPDGFGTR
jgi:hypothetical protein